MRKLAVGVCLLVISMIVFCLGGFIWFLSLGFSAGGGIPPSSNETGIVFMVSSIVAFLIGLVKAIKGVLGKK